MQLIYQFAITFFIPVVLGCMINLNYYQLIYY